MGVLRREGDALALQQGVHLLRVGGGVDAAQHDLARVHHGALGGGELLDLGHHVAMGVQLLRRLHDPGPGGGIGLVRKARQLAAVVLGPDLVPGGADAVDLHRGADHPEFFLFNVFQDTKNHDVSICLFRAPVPFSGRDAP